MSLITEHCSLSTSIKLSFHKQHLWMKRCHPQLRLNSETLADLATPHKP